MKESLSILKVPAALAGASWAFILIAALSGASAEWISYNVSGAFLVAFPSTLMLVVMSGIIAIDALSRRFRTQK